MLLWALESTSNIMCAPLSECPQCCLDAQHNTQAILTRACPAELAAIYTYRYCHTLQTADCRALRSTLSHIYPQTTGGGEGRGLGGRGGSGVSGPPLCRPLLLFLLTPNATQTVDYLVVLSFVRNPDRSFPTPSLARPSSNSFLCASSCVAVILVPCGTWLCLPRMC